MWYSAYLHLYTMSVENNRDVIYVMAKAFTYEASATIICHWESLRPKPGLEDYILVNCNLTTTVSQ